MFESMTEQESRESILESVKAYCEKFHMQDRQWKKGSESLMRRGFMTAGK